MASATQSIQFSNIAPGNTLPFTLKGGKYTVITKSTGAGTIDLTTLAADATTYVKVITTIAAVTGYATIDLAPGQYRIEISGFTANYVSVNSIPT